MPTSLIIDTPGGSNMQGYPLRNVGTLHVGGAGVPTAGYVGQFTGDLLVTGDLDVNGVVGGAVAWASLTGIPSYASRWPTWSEVTSKPTTFTPSAHVHAWADITSGLPAYTTRWPTWTEVTSKPSTFTPSAHTHDWADVTGEPVYTTRWPAWSEVTSKPSTFPPDAHTHSGDTLTPAALTIGGQRGAHIVAQATRPTGVEGRIWVQT